MMTNETVKEYVERKGKTRRLHFKESFEDMVDFLENSPSTTDNPYKARLIRHLKEKIAEIEKR